MTAKSKREEGKAATLPEFRRIPLSRIQEADLPSRATMSEIKKLELVESMRAIGQIEPVSVEQIEAMFLLITGHRRFLAARQLKWDTLAALVYAEGSAQVLAMQLHENVVREDLNPAEEALFMAQAREGLKLDEAGLCEMFHRGPDYIARRFALLRGDQDIFAALQRGEIRVGVSHELNRITADDMRNYYLDCARRADPPARVVHQWVEQWKIQARQRPGGGEVEGAAPEQTPINSPLQGNDGGAPGAVTGEIGAAPAPVFGCELCGGSKDPYNLITVQLHKWHWDQILESVERAAKVGDGRA